MTVRIFRSVPAIDPGTGQLVKDGEGVIYDPLDTGLTTPLSVMTLAGSPMATVPTGPNGLTAEFMVDIPDGLTAEVRWVSGSFIMLLQSFEAVLEAAQEAAASSEASHLAAVAAQEAAEAASNGSSLTTHGQLAGLDSDDHPQYLNASRGDQRYYTKGTVEALLDSRMAQNTAFDRSRVNHTGTQPVSTVDGLEMRLAALESSVTSGGLTETLIKFSTVPGADDDARLLSAIAEQQSGTLKGRTILLDENRDYTFTQQVVIPSGFSLQGTFRPQDQPRSSRPVGNRVLLRMSGTSAGKGWLKIAAGDTFGVSVSNLSVDGNAASSLVDGSEDNGGVLWTSVFRDISVQNAKNVVGSKNSRLLVTACSFDGWWNVNNIQETAWNIGGSDFFSAPTMMLLDSPPALLPFDEFISTFSYMSNGWFRNIYCTADGHAAVLIQGSNNTSQNLFIKDSVLEGRNASHPSPGALVRMNAGQAMIQGCRLAFAMGNPDLITSRSDKGAIHVAGGNLTVSDVTYQRGNTVTSWPVGADDPVIGPEQGEDVPFIYVAAGAKVRVRNIVGNGPTGSWSGKPVVKQALPGLADVDDSVTLVTAQIADAPSAAGDTATGFANSGTSVTVAKPANVITGDLLVAAVYARGGTAAYTSPPAGWSEIAPSTDNTTVGAVRLYTRRVSDSGAEPASYVWAGGGSGRHVGVIARVTGAAEPALDAAGAVATGIGGPDRIILPGVTATADLDLLLLVGTSNATGGDTAEYTVPEGCEVVASVQTETGASESGLTLAVQSAVAAGATGTRVMTATSSSSSSVGYMAALKSAG